MKLIYFFDDHVKPHVLKGKKYCNPSDTGKLTAELSCIRENDVNMYFYTKDGTTIAFDTGHLNFPELEKAFAKIEVDPLEIEHVFITHADVDHAGGVDATGRIIFPNAQVYLGKEEEVYLTRQMHRTTKLGFLKIKNCVQLRPNYRLISDGEEFSFGTIQVQALHIPGHTLGHYCYLIDDKILVTGDCLAINSEGGYSFSDFFTQFPALNKKSLHKLEELVHDKPLMGVATGHSGYRTDIEKVFSHIDESAMFSRKAPFDAEGPVDFTKYMR